MSAAEESLRFTGLFECELLVELMLRYWNHPRATDDSFRNDLLELAAEVLRASSAGQETLPDIAPEKMNLVAAIWCAEFSSLQAQSDMPLAEREPRIAWLEQVRRAVPSCFCNPDELTGS